MTEKEAYKGLLMELRKAKAPHIHIEEFNYFMNRAIQDFVNNEYKIFETTQQTSDALSTITSSGDFIFNNTTKKYTFSGLSVVNNTPQGFITGNKYNSDFLQVNLPGDYFHLLNCVSYVKTKFNYKCYAAGYTHSIGSKKLNADSAADNIDNAWLKPSFNNTFYKQIDHSNVLTRISSATPPPATNNVVIPDLQLYYGNSLKFAVDKISIEYLKKPKVVSLTTIQINTPTDTSALLDFPDYVCNELIKTITKIVLENSKDPRLQTFVPTNKSVD